MFFYDKKTRQKLLSRQPHMLQMLIVMQQWK